MDIWSQLRHPNIVSLRDCFVSKDFGGVASLFFVYDYHPASITLSEHFFSPNTGFPSENVLWSFTCQLVSALKTIHSTALACRILNASKIILTGKNRLVFWRDSPPWKSWDHVVVVFSPHSSFHMSSYSVSTVHSLILLRSIRISSVAIFDVLNYDGGKNILHFQVLLQSTLDKAENSIDIFTVSKKIWCVWEDCCCPLLARTPMLSNPSKSHWNLWASTIRWSWRSWSFSCISKAMFLHESQSPSPLEGMICYSRGDRKRETRGSFAESVCYVVCASWCLHARVLLMLTTTIRLCKPSGMKGPSIDDVCTMLAPRLIREVSYLHE